MKNLFLILLLLAGRAFTAHAQTVASDCTAPDSVKMQYMTGADMLALKEIYARNLPYKDSITIPQFWTDTILRPMLAVYNAVTLPARDTIVNMYIRTPYALAPFYLSIRGDTALSWVQNFKNGIVPCGYGPIDALLDEYKLNFWFYDGNSHLLLGSAKFQSDSNYNIPALANKFLEVPDVVAANGVTYTTNTRDLADTIYPDRIELTYSYHWGDCMSGCYMARYWKFIVYPDCSVEYAGSYGDPLDPTAITAIMPQAEVRVHPNPFGSLLHVTNEGSLKGEITLYDVLGRQAFTRSLPVGKSQINTASLPPGLYTYRIAGAKGALKTGKVLKQ